MNVTIRLPKHIVKDCLNKGWREREIEGLFSQYIEEILSSPDSSLELNFAIWLEELNEEELGFN